MQDKLIKLCGLYENVSKTTGKHYFVGYVGSIKLLVFENQDRQKDSEPQWTVFLAEREPKPQGKGDGDKNNPSIGRRT